MENKIKFWFAKNKNGFLMMFTDEPTRGDEKWFGNYYLNSVAHDALSQMLENSQYGFEDDAQYIEFTNQKIEDND